MSFNLVMQISRKLLGNDDAKHSTKCNLEMVFFYSSQNLFNESHIYRTWTTTPTESADGSIDYSFYVNYPNQSVPMVQNILASVIKYELSKMQLDAGLLFSIETSFLPLVPPVPTSDQSSNTVKMKILHKQADQVWKLKQI